MRAQQAQEDLLGSGSMRTEHQQLTMIPEDLLGSGSMRTEHQQLTMIPVHFA
jgi:hypothetical protein